MILAALVTEDAAYNKLDSDGLWVLSCGLTG